ncbi:RagB/SusD family nutrient uptake outer membrane protein [Sphingobacterium sp. E70]|nr:RagB/SusD family nutrient uptake outer membrane protein [Sphingobacterium sp. E70]
MENCFNTVPEAAAAPYAAEARFFRAYFYFDKLKRFGDVPWYDKVIDQNNEEQLTKPRDPRTLVVTNILADLDYAIEHLSSVKSDEKVTKWTALALKSRVALLREPLENIILNLICQGRMSYWRKLRMLPIKLLKEGSIVYITPQV